MKVRDLLAQLALCDPDAEMRLSTRQEPPISGVVAESQLRRNEGRTLADDPEVVWVLPGSAQDRAARS